MILTLLALFQTPTPYWQQRVVYQISARLDEPTATLAGTEAVRYINHSPDTLRTISFHLYLNAFRPGSRWSAADASEHLHRFDTLRDPNYGFNHVRNVKIGGAAVAAFYPFGSDSTVVRFTLPKVLAPGDSTDVTMDWDARPSIPPRRQGRRGRSYDFAQWYPKVVVYDKYGWEEHALYPAGEFYGEFGDFFVKLDVPEDQVVGATGEAVCGDPGYAKANQLPSRHPVLNRRAPSSQVMHVDAIDTRTGQTVGGEGCGAFPASQLMTVEPSFDSGRKEMLWVARDVHNFAITMSPDYRYEGGEWNGIQVHVLYQPGDEKSWGHGIVVQNTIKMLQWENFLFGKYPWPQMTVAHRIEGGGTEFPMMEMNGSPSLGLNLHEGGHSYLMGILANNEWREGWMDEGFTSFQTAWYEEIQAKNDGVMRTLESGMLRADLDGESQPIETVSEKFRDFGTYNNMIYNRGELFLEELRRMVGDQQMLEILHRYYARWALHHVDEAAFKAVAEEVTHRDLSTFFAQWLHAVTLTDYAIGAAHRSRTDSGWSTTVQVLRKAPGIFPVTIAVYGTADTVMRTVDGTEERQTLSIATRSRPVRVMLDPNEISHDWNMLNNQRYLGAWDLVTKGGAPTTRYFDSYFSPQISRDHLTIGYMPAVWFNDAGGLTFGLRARTDYLGRFEQGSGVASCSTGVGATIGLQRKECDFTLTAINPTWWRAPNVQQVFSAYRVEGRAGGGLSIEKTIVPHAAFGPEFKIGGSANWTATYDMAYLPTQLWDDGGTGEAALWAGMNSLHGRWKVTADAKLAGGVMYGTPAPGFTTANRYDAQPYLRPEVTLSVRHGLGARSAIAVRGYGAAVFSATPVLSQRRIFAAGADPYQTILDPLVRSAGAPLVRDDCWCRWHTPGDGNLRGYGTALSSDRMATINLELTTRLARTKHPFLSQASVAFFGDAGVLGAARGIGGVGDSSLVTPPRQALADAGIGVRLNQRIGQLSWTTRIDLPFFVSDPAYAFAQQQHQVDARRLLLSFSPVIR